MTRSWSIRWWLVTLSLAVSLPLLLLLGWMFGTELQRQRKEARESALRTARATAARLSALHEESASLLARMVARAPSSGVSGCDQLFAVVEFFPHYVNLFLFAEDGSLICSADPEREHEAISLEAARWVQSEIGGGRVRVGQPMIRFIDGRWVSILTAKGRGGILALVQLPQLISGESEHADTTVTIINSAGVVLARSIDAQRWTGRSVRGAEVTELVLREREGRAEADGIDGVSRQYGFTHLSEMSWFIYAGVPTASVMAPVRAMALRGLLGGGLLVCIVLLFAIRLARAIQRPIDALSRAAHVVAREGYSTFVPVEGPREVALLGEAFNEMVSGRSAAEMRLVQSERDLKALSDRLLTVQEEERTRIARELHDDLGQSLTALKMDVQGLLDGSFAGSEAVRQRIAHTLDSTAKAVQRISAELRPSILDDLGLIAAIESEARLFEERTAVECEVSTPPDGLSLESAASSAVYRIVQEALTNVARHSDATRVEIRLRQRGEEILLELRDDGRGISPAEIHDPRSLGLIGIRERAALLGGSVQIEGVPGRGTIVSVRLPRERHSP